MAEPPSPSSTPLLPPPPELSGGMLADLSRVFSQSAAERAEDEDTRKVAIGFILHLLGPGISPGDVADDIIMWYLGPITARRRDASCVRPLALVFLDPPQPPHDASAFWQALRGEMRPPTVKPEPWSTPTAARHAPVPGAPKQTPQRAPSSSSSASLYIQTNETVDKALREEFSRRVCNVDGLDRFLFGSQSVQSRIDAVMENVRLGGSLPAWPAGDTSETSVRRWLESLEARLGDCGTGGMIGYTTTHGQIEGTRNRAQVDFFIKRRSSAARKTDWRDFYVIVEHTSGASPGRFDKFVQLARYVQHVFHARPLQRYQCGLTLVNSKVDIWLFDRAGAFCGHRMDVAADQRAFVRTLVGFCVLTEAELGFDTVLVADPANDARRVKVVGHDRQSTTRPPRPPSPPSSEIEIELELESSHFKARDRITGRATSCFKSKDGLRVARFSWTEPGMGEAERRTLELARACGVPGVPDVHGWRAFESTDGWRGKLDFSQGKLLRNQGRAGRYTGTSLRRALQDARGPRRASGSGESSPAAATSPIDGAVVSSEDEGPATPPLLGLGPDDLPSPRQLYCLVTAPVGSDFTFTETDDELRSVFSGVATQLAAMHRSAAMVHRDVSLNNILKFDPSLNGNLSGSLIDFEYAKLVDGPPSGATQITGTLCYLSIQQLQAMQPGRLPDFVHTIRHDFESLLYCIMDVCTSRTRADDPSVNTGQHPFADWVSGDYRSIEKAKIADTVPMQFEYRLEQFRPELRWMRRFAGNFRNILFGSLAQPRLGAPADIDAELITPLLDAFAQQAAR